MSVTHLESVAVALVIYTILALVYFGWGVIFYAIISKVSKIETIAPITYYMWTGWGLSLMILQSIHILYPLSAYTVIPVFSIGLLTSASLVLRAHGRIPSLAPRSSWKWLATIGFVTIVVAAWIASRSMLPPTNYDSGLYHFTAIRWINAFPLVPGLGNLHGRLAFNQSMFTYVAALNLYPVFEHGRSIANSFLLLLSSATLIEASVPFIRRPLGAVYSHPFCNLVGIFSLPILAYWALHSDGLASPSPDLASLILQVVLFVMVARIVGGSMDNEKVSISEASALGFLTGTAVSVKLSNVVFGAAVFLFVLFIFIAYSRGRARELACIMVPAGLVVLVLAARGVLLSGAPLYPSVVGYVDLDWSVPVERVREEARWVYSWARQPWEDWSDVLGNWNWLPSWLRRIASRRVEIVYPSGYFLALASLGVLAWARNLIESNKRLAKNLCLILVPISGTIFWFFSAPDPRFANAVIVLLPVAATLVVLDAIRHKVDGGVYLAWVCALFLFGNANFLGSAVKNNDVLKNISFDGWQEVPEVPFTEIVTDSGVTVRVPVNGNQCWDSPIPCTPYFNPDLRLRRPGSPSSGFSVR